MKLKMKRNSVSFILSGDFFEYYNVVIHKNDESHRGGNAKTLEQPIWIKNPSYFVIKINQFTIVFPLDFR